MEYDTVATTLSNLGITDPQQTISNLEDGRTCLLKADDGSTIALIRRGKKYDTLVLGAQADCPLPSLRAVLETAVLPLSDTYAAKVGVALPERDALRKRIREASVALDMIAKGRLVSVDPPEFPLHSDVKKYVQDGASSIDDFPEQFINNNSVLNQLQANVLTWTRATDRVVQIAKDGPKSLLSVEEETVFWSSLDAALLSARTSLASQSVKISLEILARKRRATGFLLNATTSIDSSRRKAAAVLKFLHGLPLVSIRTADDIQTLKKGVTELLEHIVTKLRMSSLSIERVLSLTDAMASDVSHSMQRILLIDGGLLSLPYQQFTCIFDACCELFETWETGFDHCRKVARDSARKMGEAIPPRQKSPLKDLQKHLMQVHELRSDHHAIRSVLTFLSSRQRMSSNQIEALDRGLAILVDQCKSLNHFDLKTKEQLFWDEKRAVYRSSISKIEETLSSNYSDIAKNASSFEELAVSLRGFKCVLDKSFMVSVITSAISSVLELGSKTLCILKKRHQVMMERLARDKSNSSLAICTFLMESRLLSKRVFSMDMNLKDVCGESNIPYILDVREFSAEILRFGRKVNPSEKFLSWVKKIAADELCLPLFTLVKTTDEQVQILPCLSSNTLRVFEVVRSVRQDRDLHSVFNEKHLELARSSKSLLAVHSKIDEALRCFNRTCLSISSMEDTQFLRLSCLLEPELDKAYALLERGFKTFWNHSLRELENYSTEVLELCSSLCYGAQILLECDRDMVVSLVNLKRILPCLSRGSLSEEAKHHVVNEMRAFSRAKETVVGRFTDFDVERYLHTTWMPLITEAVVQLLKNLQHCWLKALHMDELLLPTIFINTVSSSGHRLISCAPDITNFERLVYQSLGHTYDGFARFLCTGLAGIFESNDSWAETCYGLTSFHMQSAGALTNSSKPQDPFSAIGDLRIRVSERLGEWNVFKRFLVTDETCIPSLEHELPELPEILEFLVCQIEEIRALHDLPLFSLGSDHPLSLDCGALSNHVRGNLHKLLNNLSHRFAIKAAETSQTCYKDISVALSVLKNTVNSSGMGNLLELQRIKEKYLPILSSTIHNLESLENKFENISLRLNDSSLFKPRSTETWILADSLRSHFEELSDSYDHRSKSVLLNKGILLQKYEEERKVHQNKLAGLFEDFQTIRNDVAGREGFIESEVLLQDLEHQLTLLESHGEDLERIGKALGSDHLPERKAPGNVLQELRRVKEGIKRLKDVEQCLQNMLRKSFKSVEPSTLNDELECLQKEIVAIGKATGAKREAKRLTEITSKFIKANSSLSDLWSVELSPPRERDLLQRFFGQSYPEVRLGDTPVSLLWELNLSGHEVYLRNVLENAAGEAALCDFLSNIAKVWTGRKCSFSFHFGVAILQEIPDLLNDLDEHLQALETMQSSRHARLFESERIMWERRLSECHSGLELLVDVQSQWAHLHSLFGRDDSSGVVSQGLRVDLQEEFNVFSNVHVRFLAVGKELESAQGILEGLERIEGLDDMLGQLKGVVRGLSKFLETQRFLFPRFFFLSDNDLLQVLSVTSEDLECISSHIGKLFPGISRLTFEKNGHITEIPRAESKEGELISFIDPVCVSGGDGITEWLTRLQCVIEETLKRSLSEAVKVFGSLYSTEWNDTHSILTEKCFRFPAQVCLLGSKIVFTQIIESCMMDGAYESVYRQMLARFTDILMRLSSMDCASSDTQGLGRRNELLRVQILKEVVYQRDFVRRLVNADVRSPLSHLWSHEVRYYASYNQDSERVTALQLRCASATFDYGWEYLGMGDTLVHTPVTSRCFLSLSEALRRGYGGSPFGPAGTGKTETVKALGRMHGRFVAVFNCDESFDSVSVGRILAGACRVGCWVCFDEFNRLSASILSSTSGQLAILQQSIRQGVKQVPNFHGGSAPIAIQPGVGIFVTMNPTYTGRRDLPANLKSLFRPCAMSKPDSASITEVLLLSNGFKTSDFLSKKIVSLFESLKNVLGARSHYDFGLRSLKSCIVACGNLLRATLSNHPCDDGKTSRFEENIVVQGVAEVLKPKLDMDHVADYEATVGLSFTNASCFASKLPDEIEILLSEVVTKLKLVEDVVLMEKVRQLYCLLRHQPGVILVGPSGSGKSTTWRILHEAMKLYLLSRESDSESEMRKTQRSSITVIDAKLLSMRELYGFLDPLTREWTDGIFTKTLRYIVESKASGEDSFPLHWVVFDGDVDPNWVENLNSVLDDNRILTLPTGEQIPLLNNTRIIFETHALNQANPSTVSRCGMVCFGSNNGVEEFFCQTVLEIANQYCDPDHNSAFLRYFGQLVVRLAKNALQSFPYVMNVPLESILNSFTVLLSSALLEFSTSRSALSESKHDLAMKSSSQKIPRAFMLRIMLMTTVKAVGAGVSQLDCKRITEQLMEVIASHSEFQESLSGVVLPSDLSNVNITSDGHFVKHQELIPPKNQALCGSDIGNPDLVVPTSTTVRLESLLLNFLSHGTSPDSFITPLILCGPPGCGKSMLLTTTLRKVPNISLTSLSFSSETKPENLLAALKGSTTISKRPNGAFVLHPKSAGCRVVLFCDEVNLEKPDLFETQTSVSFLRGLAEHGGFWEGSPPRWVTVEGVQIVAACNPDDTAGRYKLPERFLRHCNVIYVEQPTFEDLITIYGTFVSLLLKSYHPQLGSRSSDVTTAMVEYFRSNKEEFCPREAGPLKPHYIYSPRELSRWIRGMTQLLLSDQAAFGSGHLLDIPTEQAWSNVTDVFVYEARRLFCDRLVSAAERNVADSKLRRIASQHLGAHGKNLSDVLFTSWTSEHVHGAGSRFFKKVGNLSMFRTLVYQKLRVFAEEEGLGGSWMSGNVKSKSDEWRAMIDQFAVTDDVLTHLTRIERVLCNPMGHAVLIGAPGTGKKTLARFAAWMLGVEVHQVRSHSTYTEQDFASDLRAILKKSALSNRHLVIIFDESHSMDSGFLELMNSLLACGEVPGLFSGDERVALLNELGQTIPNKSSVTSSEQSLYTEFVRRIRANLHIIFTISAEISGSEHVNSNTSSNIFSGDISKRSPALYNRCTVDWIGDWARPTLEAVAELKIEVSHGRERNQIIRAVVNIHESSKLMYETAQNAALVSPRHFLEFIEQLNRIALEKGNEIHADVDRHTEGLCRLRNAGTAVDTLKDSLCEKTERLRDKEKDASEMLAKMIDEQRLAEKSKVGAEQLALAALEASNAVQEREAEVSETLAVVQPKVDAAREAVGSIRKEFLDELRAMPSPPPAVKVALEAVMMVLDASRKKAEAQHSWSHIRAQMRSSEFISSIVNFDVETISKGLRAKVEKKILRNPDFDVTRISYASRAAGPLAEWTLAILDYSKVKETVEPLEVEVLELQNEQAELLEKQEIAEEEADLCQQRIDDCKTEYARLVAEAEKVRSEIEESKGNLSRAEEMLNSLAEEWNRWKKELNVLNGSAVTIWGNAVLGAAFVSYAGALDHSNRLLLVSEWKDILKREAVSFESKTELAHYLTTTEERGFWSSRDLPTDKTSLENFAILKRAARFPLIVDPTRRSGELLRRVLVNPITSNDRDSFGSSDSIQTEVRVSESSFTATGKKSYMRTLESAMRFGTPVLVDDAEKFDRAVTPLLGQESSFGDSAEYVESMTSSKKRNSRKSRKNVCQRVVRLGDKDVFLNSNFRLYLSTSDLNSVPRCAVSRSNVVSFELSPAALQASCVSRSVEILAPQLGERRRSSLSAALKYLQRKRVLEDLLLSTVNNVDDIGAELLKGPLLSDLANLKDEVRKIEERQKEEQKTSAAIAKSEKLFAPLGLTAIKTFEIVRALVDVYPLYRFTSSYFLRIFEEAILGCREIIQALPNAENVRDCEDALLKHIYARTAASLFPGDRIPFAAALSLVQSSDVEVHPQEKNLQQLRVALQALSAVQNSKTLHSKGSTELLSNLPEFLQQAIAGYERKPQVNGTRPFDVGLQVLCRIVHEPFRVRDGVGDLACLLPDGRQLVFGDRAAPESALKSTLHNFSESNDHDSSSLFQPILLCSRGENSDPALLLTELANEYQIPLASLAMGSTNSEAEVSDLMNHAMRRAQAGTKTLVLLKNMHLAGKSTMNTIQAFLLNNRAMLHYLLVMVAELPFTSPSVSLMRIASISNFFSFEAPRNFRTGMTYAIERMSSFESDYRSRTLSSRTALDGMKILLAFLHSCLTERALNSPVGFSKKYEFSESDLAAGWNLNLQVSASLDSDPAVLSFSHMLKTAVYGCHIENETDQEILDALVDDIFSKERIHSISSGSVSVVKPPREPDVIRIPIDREKRDRFLLDLPLEISPEWYYMPSATTKAKRSKEGRLAVQKLVSMSRGMTQSPNDFKETTVIIQDEAQAKVDEILQRALELPDIVHADSSDFSSKTSLDRFWKAEKVVLGALIASIKSVAKDIINPDRLTPKRMNSLSVFKQELFSICSTASHKLPSLWKDVAKVFGENLTVLGVFSKISDCVRNIPLTKESKSFSMSHILRPKSFLTALRLEAAAERGVSPHTLIPVLSFRKQVQVGECLLSGLGLNGAIWDCKKECFVLSGSSSGSVGTVALQWRPADSFGEKEHIIDVPLYGTSPQNILIATMRISMDDRDLHRLWRLCGVSFFVVEV
ncbi:Cytoplasmic dynein heavy chain [Gracilaria domingensis]|nr:Cytoplasmic dynein heavy chain [Gracilaria domingensis]